ncbi:MAG: 4Fe-4S dicluster domain-containing protein [Anaerolineae bacterium]|nr:4Fe-4S dicluster domain-containing protein [Anaerolineae bacterium]
MGASRDLSFAEMVQEQSGEPVQRCYFCQKCTAGCPVAYAMDVKPAQLLRLIQLGEKEAVLGSSAIWLCVNCQTCGARCPNQIYLAGMYDALRQMALGEGYAPEPSVYALHRSFLDSIKMWGRVHELTMLMEYKMRLLPKPAIFFDGLVSDLMMGGGLIAKGKISFVPERVKRLKEVRRLYETNSPGTEVEP